MEFDMVIAECPRCGVKVYSFTEEDALEKLSKHKCVKRRKNRLLGRKNK